MSLVVARKRPPLDVAHKAFLNAIDHVSDIEDFFVHPRGEVSTQSIETFRTVGLATFDACKRKRDTEKPFVDEWVRSSSAETSTSQLLRRAYRFITQPEIALYDGMYRQMPRLVNVVSLAYVSPSKGSNTTLPLNLTHIASRCTGAYFAKDRFAAVQLAFREPRCRVLIFHTGRLVGTGASGTLSARLAIMKAVRQMLEEADVHLHIDKFDVINSVGASNLHTKINCEAFANAHSSQVHYDLSSFVGLAWRPPDVPICIELYSTGRLNIPGACDERDLITSYSSLLPRLLAFRSELWPEGVGLQYSDNASDDSAADDEEYTSANRAVEYTDDFWKSLKQLDVELLHAKTAIAAPTLPPLAVDCLD